MRARPIVVNMFAGPGAGKSTLAAMVFGEMKSLGAPIVVEQALEFAKDLVFEGRNIALGNQVFVLGEQMQRIERVVGKVDVIITDSPVLMSAIYAPKAYPESLTELALWAYRRHPSYDVFVERHESRYETAGRIHTEAEAHEVDRKILDFLAAHRIGPLHRAKATRDDARTIVQRVLDRLAADQAA